MFIFKCNTCCCILIGGGMMHFMLICSTGGMQHTPHCLLGLLKICSYLLWHSLSTYRLYNASLLGRRLICLEYSIYVGSEFIGTILSQWQYFWFVSRFSIKAPQHLVLDHFKETWWRQDAWYILFPMYLTCIWFLLLICKPKWWPGKSVAIGASCQVLPL